MKGMLPAFQWVDTDQAFRLALRHRPSGGPQLEAELLALKCMGVDVLVSLLEPDESHKLGLEKEAELAQTHGLHFISFPIPDHSVPTSLADTKALCQDLLTFLQDGKGVLLHCFAGIGRSGTIGGATMNLAGFDVHDACLRMSRARGFYVPETEEQRAWLDRFAQFLRG